ncbi:MAG TPA: STAS domain-containing protein [Magnetospirillaceae bacterium]|nr:STAS domain-containing protein [Magnetospirillaceae bacterium]
MNDIHGRPAVFPSGTPVNQDAEIVPGFNSETDDTLRLEIERMAGVERGAVIRMTGYLDGFNVGFFSKRVEKAIDRGFLYLSFDLEKVSYISSRGIGAFTSFLMQLKERGGGLHLYGAQAKVLDIFRILGFLDYFNIGKTREEAAAVFRGASAAVFPLRIPCPVCGKSLRAPKAGKGYCPGCKCLLTIDRHGITARG